MRSSYRSFDAAAQMINISMAIGQKKWRHYTVRETGECAVLDDNGREKLVSYDMGIVETGRSHVFAGYFFKVTLADGEEIIGEDGGSMVRALRRLAYDIRARSLRLHSVGLSGQWQETGLSQNTGWGYFGPSQKLMHLMDKIPDDAVEALDRTISEAVRGISIGLA
jgi:hypothetical protein